MADYAPGTLQNTPAPAMGQTLAQIQAGAAAQNTPSNAQAYTTQATSNGPVNTYLPNSTSTSPVVSPIQQPLQPQSEDQIYGNMVSQGQSIIDAINASTQAQIQSANLNIDQSASKAQQDQNAIAAISGNFGSSSAAGANAISQDATAKKNAADQPINAAAQQQVATYLQNLQTAAQSQENYEQTTGFSQGQSYQQYLQTQASTTLQGLAKSGVTLAQLQSQAQAGNPVATQTMQTLLQAYGGDQNALSAAAAMATPVDTVVQSFTNGSTYNQVVRDPNTNAVSVQSFDLGVTIPTGWTTTKVGTNSVLMQDPNNPSNSIIYTTDPLGGPPNVTGTGTGQQLASLYTGNQSSDSSSSSSTSPTGAGTASTTISSILGVDPTTSFDDVVSGPGLGSLTAAVIQNEGGSPAKVVNNPGNVKFVGAPGQIDSGVKATDGGTFASYSTPAAGQQAIASTLNSIASKQQNPTLQSVVDAYTNTGSTQAPGTGTNGLPTAEYGLLANVQGFDPTGKNSSAPAGVDTAAMNYLNEYLTQGKTPTAASVGISTRTGSGALFNTISQRADDVYFQATGQHLPDQNLLASNKKLISGNNSLLNSLAVQENTIKSNSALLQKNVTAANINQYAPVLNGIIDNFKQFWTGNPDVASYVGQTATLSNELGSLLALKNASGTTVHDKLESAGLINADTSAAQEATVVNTLMQEAQNGRQAIGSATASLYQQIDPAGLQPGNPANAPGYQELVTGAGFTDNFDGTFSAPDGTTWSVDAQGNVTQQ